MLLIIVVIAFNSIYYSIKHRCQNRSTDIKYSSIKYARGAKYSNPNKRSNISMIDIKLDRDLGCGVYNVKTTYGQAKLYVYKFDGKYAELKFPKSIETIDKIDLFDLWDIEKIIDSKDEFIKTLECCD